jgi:Tol biopolymer transport system component
MDTRRTLSTVAVLLVLVACSDGASPDRPHPTARAGPSPSIQAGAPSAVTSLSGRIVFDNFHDVWSINANGTGLTRLTRTPGPDFDATWSPNGARIAFRSERNGDPEIWLMKADGSGQRRLARGLSPAWSPDGSMIAYGNPDGLSVMNADGSGQHRVPHTAGGEYPSWSPDGRRIAFNSNLSGDHVMYIVDVDGSRVVDLSRAGEGWQVDWSPNGRSILFTSHRDNPENYTDIYVMRPDGSGVKRLTHARAYTPSWSSDGSHIVFSAPGLFVMRADGSGVTSLPVDGVGETSLPDWSR